MTLKIYAPSHAMIRAFAVFRCQHLPEIPERCEPRADPRAPGAPARGIPGDTLLPLSEGGFGRRIWGMVDGAPEPAWLASDFSGCHWALVPMRDLEFVQWESGSGRSVALFDAFEAGVCERTLTIRADPDGVYTLSALDLHARIDGGVGRLDLDAEDGEDMAAVWTALAADETAPDWQRAAARHGLALLAQRAART